MLPARRLGLAIIVILAAHFTAAVAVADPWFQTFADDHASAAIGGWRTIVVRAAPQEFASRAMTSETALAVSTPRLGTAITTGSVAKNSQYFAAAGPRLTGHSHALTGNASYYWEDQRTATGERFDKRALTAAHKTLPFGTKVRVTRIDSGDSVVVRINDRGPFRAGRVIDLSERAAENLRMTGAGIAPVRLEVLGR